MTEGLFLCHLFNSPIQRRTQVVGLFPNEHSLLRLAIGIFIDVNEKWVIAKIYLQPRTKTQKNHLPNKKF